MKVYIVGNVERIPIEKMFLIRGWKIVNNPDDADLHQFTGGSDVDPSLYGEERHASTYSNPDRDAFESHIYRSYPDIKKAGICRGGQFLNVMNGGKMWQHVNNHGGCEHVAYDITTGNPLMMSSDHHQMIRPTDNAEVLLTAARSTYRESATERNDDLLFTDIEAVLYPNSLCYQPHPEWVGTDHPCQELYFHYLKEHLNCAA